MGKWYKNLEKKFPTIDPFDYNDLRKMFQGFFISEVGWTSFMFKCKIPTIKQIEMRRKESLEKL